jgi:hypothetical protein
MKRSLAVLAVVFFVFFGKADAIGVAMLKNSCDSCEELASALEGNDPGKIMREGGLNFFYKAISRNYPEIGLQNSSQLPGYIRTLVKRPCPSGKYRLSTAILSSGELGEITRSFREGENCLWDINLNVPILSLSCGNVVIPSKERVRKEISPFPVIPSVPQNIEMQNVGNKTVNNYNYGEKNGKEEKRPMAWWKKTLLWTGAAIATGAIVALIYDEISEDNNRSYHFSTTINNSPGGGGAVEDAGGPVNPPSKLDPSEGGPVNPSN